MELMDAIMSRRSIRNYAKKPLSEQDVQDLLKAAMAAPSAGNCQPWHFLVINDHAVMDKIPEFHPHAKMLHDASLAIAVCWDREKELADGYGIQDCAAAIENILLAAHAKGLGAVWLGIFPREQRINALKKLLGLPENIMPLSVVSIGYPAETKPPADRFDESKIHYNRW